jgi:hypothetical protein
MIEQIEKWLSHVGQACAGSIGSVRRASAQSGTPRMNSISSIRHISSIEQVLAWSRAGARKGWLAPLAQSVKGWLV